VPHRPIVCFDTPLVPSSPYYFGQEIVTQLPDVLKGHDFDRCFLVTSRKLMPLFGEDILGALRRDGVSSDAVLIKESEQHKSWRTLRGLGERLVARGVTKDSILIALGGGVIGNVVGLAAALLYRGVRFVEVPTTIMAQTDSTLSNKQAINGKRGKNQFGVYHAPLFVWADAAYAAAEPPRQQRAGIVEGIKNVFISENCTSAADVLLQEWESGNRFYELLRHLIDSKLAILRRDPTEKGACLILEYGHTFGHAVEWLAGNLYHGEAVAIGMCLAAETSHALGHMSRPFLQDHYRLLGTRLGVPTRLAKNISAATLLHAMRSDNKRTKKGLRFLLLRGCGEFVNPDGDFQTAVPPERLTEVLRGIEAEAVLPDSIIS
jgi:3-dehydroquinate synthase